MPSNQTSLGAKSRRRRPHTKSRRGCRNCKLRRIKCDETEPQCQRCLSFDVTCNYKMTHNSDLQPSSTDDSPFGHLVFDSKPNQTISLPAITVGYGPGSFQMDTDSLARLDRFRNRTALSFSSAMACDIYQNDVLKLAMQHPFLMHIILSVTATHDRILFAAPDNNKKSVAEVYHGAQGAGLLSQKLSSPILYEDRDALWSSAAILGIASMTSIEASTPAEAWPLKPDDPSDLDWLNLSVNKRAIWRATDPLRPDSIFYRMGDEYRQFISRPKLRGVEEIAPDFVQLCSLDGPLTPDQNPYYSAASVLSDVWQSTCTAGSSARYITFLAFLGYMKREYRYLLGCKDPRALLIFAYWYALLPKSVWFIARRARLECQAICLYLEKHHSGDIYIQRMLQIPKNCQLNHQTPAMF